ncbi:MAG: DUF4446 family protein [Tissierellia bacterium]|nr:DUF4446 family protein [Tissierellia bacterium]
MAIVTLVMIYLIYRYIDLSIKVKRQKKRYDFLLRGRGELNIEDLLKAHSHDIDLSIKKLKALEASYAKVDVDIQENREYLNTKMMELNSNTNTDLIDKSDKQYQSLDKKLEGINSIINKKIDSKTNQLNADINRLTLEQNDKVDKLDKNLAAKMKSLDDKYSLRVNDIDAKFSNEIDKINADRSANYKKIEERHEFDISNLKKLDEENYNKLVDFINKQDKSLDENLSLAIQKVSLYKYNALQNQTGDLSFTMVLLDRINNGVMITSINGRDASYTYSKEIVDGKCLVDLSPEEEKALNMALKNN